MKMNINRRPDDIVQFDISNVCVCVCVLILIQVHIIKINNPFIPQTKNIVFDVYVVVVVIIDRYCILCQ